MSLKDKAAIVGIGQLPFAKDIGRPLMQLCSSPDPDDCDDVVEIPDSEWTAGPGSVKVPRDVIAVNPGGGDPRALNAGGQLFQGPFLVTKVPSDGTGWTDVQFVVTGPASNTRLIFDVDAVLEIWDPAQLATAVAAVEGGALDLTVMAEIGGAWDGWSFPDNGEDHSFEVSEPPDGLRQPGQAPDEPPPVLERPVHGHRLGVVISR